MDKVVVIGSGGREHAIRKTLEKCPQIEKVFALPFDQTNPKKSVQEICAWCVQNKIDYVVVTPDDPLAHGMVDALENVGIPSFGPKKNAARIESSKSFAKDLMIKYGIPTASYKVFSDINQAEIFIKEIFQKKNAAVIKADGLALGKGVSICFNEDDALAAVRAAMKEKKFGDAGSTIIIEEYLEGPEVSVLAFCDGETLVPMVSSMDHKRVNDGDEAHPEGTGDNTGGMGTIAPNPFYTDEIANECMEKIFMPTVRAMHKENCPFKGCLYFGLMLTKDGPKVIEYNCRFGDPETQVVLPLLDSENGSDLYSIMKSCTEGNLKNVNVRFKNKSACCVVLASGGYPAHYETGFEICGCEQAESQDNVQIFLAGVSKNNDGTLLTKGGRVLGVTALADTLEQARLDAYAAVQKINFKDMHYRRDIGKQFTHDV